MNWGYKILLVYVVFVTGIMFLVFKSSDQKMDLVTPDYYGKELKFQQQIDATKHVSDLSDTIKYAINNKELTISFPKDFMGKKLTGDVVLYCPSDENKDVTQNFSIQDTPLAIPIAAVNKGWYELHITWQANGISYYFEKKILI